MMDCIVTGSNVKVLAKAIYSLSRLGEELYLEPQDGGLALRTVNSSRSAYACFLFSPLFFQQYNYPRNSALRCKVVIKSVQAVFKSLSSLEKTVEKCRIELDYGKSRLTFTLHCKRGLLKTHNLSFQDSESLQALFDKESCANLLRAQPKLLGDAVLQFPASLEEVSVSVNSERVLFRNHIEDEAEQSKAMMTELCLRAEEFEEFSINTHTCITFCLKELRGLLMFAESTGLPVSVHFDEPGSPVVLSLSDSILEVNFVLATLSEESHSQKTTQSNTEKLQAPPPCDDFMSDDIDSYIIAMDTSELAGGSDYAADQSNNAGVEKHRGRQESEEEAEEEEMEGEVEGETGRPPNKKFCSLFFGSVLPANSKTSNKTLGGQEVLASDSEDEQSPATP